MWCATGLAALFALAAALVDAELVADLDRAARGMIRDARVLALVRPMRTVSTLGSGDVLLPITLLCSVMLWLRRERTVALWLPVIAVATSATLGLTKWVISKPRPSLRDYGFPSGHVYGATVFVILAVYLLWSFGASRWWQWAARAGGAVFVAAVGYSRILVDAHWLSDVVGGLVAGIAFALAMMLLLDARAAPRPR